jgi:hypothetical protein
MDEGIRQEAETNREVIQWLFSPDSGPRTGEEYFL